MRAQRLTSSRSAVSVLLFFALLLTGCAGAGPAPTEAPSASSSEARTLVVLVGSEPANIAARSLISAGTALRLQQGVVNAWLARINGQGLPEPELLASLPALNTPSWQVFPDGTMQTTYTLRPNLTWHDGQPLTAEDILFGWRVYSNADLGQANQAPMSFMSDVTAPDRNHFVITWKRLYPDAENLSYYSREFVPLPQHILGPAFERLATSGRDTFLNQTYWTQEYVGLGPYKIQNWESGSFIELVRFEGYALGTPKIGRIEMRFGSDQNIVLANLLAGTVHMVASGALTNAEPVEQEWNRTKGGSFLQSISVLNYLQFQARPEYASPSAILDPRVRRAIAHTIDKPTVVDVVFAGKAILTDTPIWTGSAWGPAVDSSVAVYPHDLRASEVLMGQAGFRKGVDGVYAGAGGRLAPFEVVTGASQDQVQEALVIADWLKAAGFDVSQRTIPAAQAQDNEVRSTYPGGLLNNTSPGETALTNLLASASIPGPNNRWVGSNRGGWSTPELDRLLSAFTTTLDRGERVSVLRQALRIYADELPLASILFTIGGTALVSALKGPVTTAPETNTAWNVHLWELQ